MAKLWQRSRTPGTALVEADLSSFCIDRPTVIFLPGIFTTHDKQQHILESIGDIESLVKRAGEPLPRILCGSYNSLSTIFNIAAYNGNPDRACSAEARKMAQSLILPLVTDKGEPISEAEAARRLRNLTLVGYSAGTVFAQEMYNAAVDLMTKSGWHADRARHVLGETVLISMAAVSRPSREKDRFTTIYLVASNDLAVRLKNRIWRPISRLFARHAGDLSIRKVSGASLLVTARMEGKMWEWREEEDGTPAKAPIAPLLPVRLRSNHEPQHYMTCDDGHNGFSRIALYALINAIGRKARATVDSLLEPVGAKRRDEATYRARISNARIRGETRNKRQKRGKHDLQPADRPSIHPAPPYSPGARGF